MFEEIIQLNTLCKTFNLRAAFQEQCVDRRAEISVGLFIESIDNQL